MILDIKWEIKNGAPILMAFMPKSLNDIMPAVDDVGYITFDIKNYEWREIKLPSYKIKLKDMIEIPCLECGRIWKFYEDSGEANGIFKVFCQDNVGYCENKYTLRLIEERYKCEENKNNEQR